MSRRKAKSSKKRIRFPFVKWEDAKERGLSPEAIRLFVACWTQAAPTGFVPKDMPAKIYERFGDGMNDPISDLDAMFAELESLGFAKSVTKEEDCFSFEPSGSWLS